MLELEAGRSQIGIEAREGVLTVSGEPDEGEAIGDQMPGQALQDRRLGPRGHEGEHVARDNGRVERLGDSLRP
jgi:hypothetical protein